MQNRRLAQLLAFAVLMEVIGWQGAFADMSLVELGDMELNKRNYDEAISFYRRACSEEKFNTILAMNRLYKLLGKLHRYDEAQQILIELVNRTRNRQYRMELAKMYKSAGDFYSAQRQFEQLVADAPNDQQSLIGIGECLEATGNYDAARDSYNRAANITGEYTSLARQRLKRIENASSITAIDVDAEIGKWPVDRMPLKVFVVEPKDVAGFRPHLKDYVRQAVADWNNAGRGLVAMAFIADDPDRADIVVEFCDRIPGALGLTQPMGDVSGKLKRAHITIACNTDSNGRTLPAETSATRQMYEARDRMLREIALHEFGHALGLDHSSRSDDIMARGVFGLNSADVLSARQLQPGDIERLIQLYSVQESPQLKQVDRTNSPTPLAPTASQTAAGAQDDGVGQEFAAQINNSSTKIAMQDAVFNLNAGNFALCVDQLTNLVKQDPNNAQAHYLLAVSLVNLRRYPLAAKHYQQVLRLKPRGKLAELATSGLMKIAKRQN